MDEEANIWFTDWTEIRGRKLKALPSATRRRNCSILKPLTSASILHRQGFSEVAVKVLGELFNIIGDYIMFSCTLRPGDMCQRLSQVGAVDGVRSSEKSRWWCSGGVRENLWWHLATGLPCQTPSQRSMSDGGIEQAWKLGIGEIQLFEKYTSQN